MALAVSEDEWPAARLQAKHGGRPLCAATEPPRMAAHPCGGAAQAEGLPLVCACLSKPCSSPMK
jgi:hypothetical protein